MPFTEKYKFSVDIPSDRVGILLRHAQFKCAIYTFKSCRFVFQGKAAILRINDQKGSSVCSLSNTENVFLIQMKIEVIGDVISVGQVRIVVFS